VSSEAIAAALDKYRELERRRRRAQIAARKALERAQERERTCPRLPFAV
jgi:hypothetical protein